MNSGNRPQQNPSTVAIYQRAFYLPQGGQNHPPTLPPLHPYPSANGYGGSCRPVSNWALFEERLIAAAAGNSDEAFADIHLFIQQGIEENRFPDVEHYFYQIMKVNFADSGARRLFLERSLTPFLCALPIDQVALLLLRDQGQLLQCALQLKSLRLTELYLNRLHSLLLDRALTADQYVNLVLNEQIFLRFNRDKRAAIRLGTAFMRLLSLAFNDNVPMTPLSNYLRLLMALAPAAIPGENEIRILKLKLDFLTGLFREQAFSREEYINVLITADEFKLTLLHKLAYLNNAKILQTYLSVIARDCRQVEVESLIFNHSQRGSNCLHGIARSGNVEVLVEFVKFLVNYFGTPNATIILIHLARMKNSKQEQPYHRQSNLDTPMNIFLGLLRGQNPPAALAYLRHYQFYHLLPGDEDLNQPVRLSTFNCKLFFSDSALAKPTAEENKPESTQKEESTNCQEQHTPQTLLPRDLRMSL